MRRLKILSVQLVIATVLLEAALRLYNPLPFRLRGNELMLPVGLRYERVNPPGPKLDPVTVHTRNRLGFRGPDPPPDFSSRLSIVTVGGSTTECFMLSDGKTWTDVMAAELARGRPDLWVNNAGFGGHSTFGHLVLLRSVLVNLRPNVALYLAGVNDVGMEGGPSSQEFETANDWLLNRAATHSEVVNAALNLSRAWQARHLGSGDEPVDFARHPRFAMSDDEVAEVVASHRINAAGYDTRLARLVAESRQAGIEPIFVTQPALVGDGIDPTTGTNLSTVAFAEGLNGLAEWRLLQMYNDVMRRSAATHGVFVIDLAERLPKDSKYFYDFIHFSNDGARLVGQIVAQSLGPHLASKGRRPAG